MSGAGGAVNAVNAGRRGRAHRRLRIASLAALPSLAACALPLTGALAYPFCLVVGLGLAPLALVLGLRTGEATAPSPSGAPSPPSRPSVAQAVQLGDALVVVLATSLACVGANALRVQNCNVLRGLAYFALLPGMGTLYALLLGAWAGACRAQLWPHGQGRRRTLAALAVAPLLFDAARLVGLPSIDVYDHLWGYYSGSLYDENVPIDARLLRFRTATALRCVALGCGWWALGATRKLRWALAPILACVALDAVAGPRLGYAVDRAQLRRVLPQVAAYDGVVVHLPARTPPAHARAIAREHAFWLQRARARLQLPDLAPLPPVHSWVFASAADKGWWTGASNTMVVKPWLRELVLHEVALPHPLLAHEAVHVALAPHGRWKTGLPVRGLVGLNVGLLEGVAEAVGGRTQPYAPAQIAQCTAADHPRAAARRLAGAMGGEGPAFWAQPAARAYAETGSFVAWLLARCGASALVRAYGAGTLVPACGPSVEALIEAYGAWLQTLAPPAKAVCATVAATYERPSIFARPCPNEVARLQAAQANASAFEAVALQRAIVRHQGGAPFARLALVGRLVQEASPSALEEAIASARALAAEDNVLVRGRARMLEAAAQFQLGRPAEAEAALASGLALELTEATGRELYVRHWARAWPPGDAALLGALLDGRGEPWAAASMLGARAAGGDKVAAYLLGRTLAARASQGVNDDDTPALAALQAAGPLPFAPLEAERLRLLLEVDWRAGEHGGRVQDPLARAQAIEALTTALPPVSATWAADLRARFAWQAEHP